MNKSILKIISLLSAFIGVVLGVLTLIPYLGELAFGVLLLFAAPIVVVFLTRNNLFEIFTVRQGAVIGGIIGFISFMAFSILYVPLVIILAKALHYYPNYGVSMMLTNAGVGIILLLAVFMGILSATINAFTGFITFYILEFVKTLDKNNDNYSDDEFTKSSFRR